MKLKIRKIWFVLITLFLLIPPFLVTCTMSNEDHQKLSEFRLSSVLKTGTSVQEMRSHLDNWRYNYYLTFHNHCEKTEDKHFWMAHYDNEYVDSKCYKVSMISLHDDIWFTLIRGNVIYKITFDENERLETFSNRVGWTFL